MRRRLLQALLLLAPFAPAWAGMPGDVDGNCEVDVADVVLYERWLQGGAPMLDPELLGNADVAPFDSDPGASPVITPDGLNDAADLVVLQRAVGGDLTLPQPPAAPMIDPVGATTSANPFNVTFDLALPEGTPATIEFEVNGQVQADTKAVTGEPGGNLENVSFDLLALYDGLNTITATAIVGGKRSCQSASVSVTYTNTISRSEKLSPPGVNGFANTIVLTPGVSSQGESGPYELDPDGLVADGTDPTIKYFFVDGGRRLILQPGVQIKFGAKNMLVVRTGATLRVQGSSSNPVVLTSDQASPTNGYWKGIELRLSQTARTEARIDHASIRYAETGVRMRTVPLSTDPCCIADTIADVRNSEITNFSVRAVDVTQNAMGTIDNVTIIGPSGTTGVGFTDTTNTVSHETIVRNSTISGGHTGLAIVRAGPEIRANTIQGQSNRSIWIDDLSNPVVEENQLIGNGCDRISLTGVNNDVPQPTIRFNRILAPAPASGSCAHMRIVVPSGTPPIHAESNYWATANPEDVLHSLIEKSASTIVLTRPILDNSLNPIGSEIVESDSISGTLTAGATYMIDGPTTVPAGQTLTIPADTRIEFNAESGASLRVDGTLQVAGTETLPVIFTSSRDEQGASPNPSPNDWDGLSVVSSDAVLDIDGAEFRFADVAVSISNVSNSNELNRWIRNSSALNSINTFASLNNVASALIEANEIDLASGSIAIDVTNSSPRIVDNEIVDTTTAIRVAGAQSHPVIGPGNVIEDFVFSGITLTEVGDDTVIDGNTIQSISSGQRGLGIELVDSSPAITDNTISRNYYGIYIAGDSDPTINDGNVITDNVWGILLKGDRHYPNPDPEVAVHGPAPVIEDNQLSNACMGSCVSPLPGRFETDLCPTTGGNLCVFGYPYDAAPIVNVRQNDWVNLHDATAIRSKFFIEPSNPIRVDLSDFLNGSGLPGGEAFTSTIGGLSISDEDRIIRPGDTVTISFDLAVAADSVSVQLVEDKLNGAVVRTLVPDDGAGAGTHSVIWNGKADGNTLFVADDAYKVVITAMRSGQADVYAPARENGTAFAQLGASVTDEWNAHRNQYAKAMMRNNNAHRPMRAIVQWEDEPPLNPPVVPPNRVLAPDQERLFLFDGRKRTGEILPGAGTTSTSVEVGFHGYSPLVHSDIFVQDTAPVVFGVREADIATVPTISNVEVLSDPYLANPIYDQVSTIQFKLDQPGDVSVKILKPGAPDDSNPANVVADLDVTGSALLKSATWYGYDGLVSGADEVLQATQPGSYTFLIEARRPGQPSPKSTYRGTIQVRLAPGM